VNRGQVLAAVVRAPLNPLQPIAGRRTAINVVLARLRWVRLEQNVIPFADASPPLNPVQRRKNQSIFVCLFWIFMGLASPRPVCRRVKQFNAQQRSRFVERFIARFVPARHRSAWSLVTGESGCSSDLIGIQIHASGCRRRLAVFRNSGGSTGRADELATAAHRISGTARTPAEIAKIAVLFSFHDSR